MKVTLKNGSVIAALEVLSEMANQAVKPGLAFQIKSLHGQLAEQAKHYQEVKQELIQKYAVKDEEGNVKYEEGTQFVTIPAEHFAAFQELDEEVGEEVRALKLSFLNSSTTELTPMQMAKLGDLIENDLDFD